MVIKPQTLFRVIIAKTSKTAFDHITVIGVANPPNAIKV